MHDALADQILDTVDAGLANGERYRDASRATDRTAWKDVAKLTKKTEQEARQIIETWVKNGLLLKEEYRSQTRDEINIGLVVDPTKRP